MVPGCTGLYAGIYELCIACNIVVSVFDTVIRLRFGWKELFLYVAMLCILGKAYTREFNLVKNKMPF